MTQIDTKTLLDEIAGIAITTNGKPHIPRTLRDELVTHLLDTAPLSREELETVLVEIGFSCGKSGVWVLDATPYANAEILEDRFKLRTFLLQDMLTINELNIPLSAVTRRLLKDCGVIK